MSWSSPAYADSGAKHPKLSAHDERLRGLSKADLARLQPEIAQGPVALVEFADMKADELPAVNVALPIRARPELVTQIIADPAGYPRFMPTLDKVQIVARHGRSTVYDWSFNLAILHMQGRNVMTLFPAPPDRPDLASRVTIDAEGGDLGRGRFLFRVHPQGTGSLLVVSMRLDLRKANFVARQMAKAARSVNRSANLALAFSLALHVRSEAERRAANQPAPQHPRALRKPAVDLARFAPLLVRGDLLFFETRGTELDQVAVIGVVPQAADKVQRTMRNADAFGSSLVPGSKAEVVAHDATGTTFDWKIDLPIVGVSGRMRMQERGTELAVDATDGALSGGRWLFDVAQVADRASLVTGWARFSFDDTTWLLEKLASADPYLGQGMIGASQVMLLRAVRSRALR